MIEELERYARESKVDDLFRDMMTGCFRTRPNAPVRFVLEYLANEYPEESLAHARAYVDLREGVPSEKTCETSRKDARETVVVVVLIPPRSTFGAPIGGHHHEGAVGITITGTSQLALEQGLETIQRPQHFGPRIEIGGGCSPPLE